MSWTSAVCDQRFELLYPGKDAIRVKVRDEHGDPAYEDICVFCGMPSNIYIRIDPATLPTDPVDCVAEYLKAKVTNVRVLEF